MPNPKPWMVELRVSDQASTSGVQPVISHRVAAISTMPSEHQQSRVDAVGQTPRQNDTAIIVPAPRGASSRPVCTTERPASVCR